MMRISMCRNGVFLFFCVAIWISCSEKPAGQHECSELLAPDTLAVQDEFRSIDSALSYTKGKVFVLALDDTSFQASAGKLVQLSDLQSLSINCNIAKIPGEVFHLSCLQHLNLAGNNIEQVPSEIGALQNLRRLTIIENKLSVLPVSIGELDNLVSIQAGFNEFAAFPISICRLPSLKELYLNDNTLTSLPDSFMPCVNWLHST